MAEEIYHPLPLLSILNIYAPATGSTRIKEQFFHSVLNDSTLHQYLHSELYSTVILEDFNYRCDVRTMDDIVRGPPPTWSSLLDLQYHDCFKDEKQTTFKRGDLRLIIDYIFCCNRLRFSINRTEQLYLSPEWTDHAMLSVTSFNFAAESTKGPGAWKADPFLARRKEFRQQLAKFLEQLQPQLSERQSIYTLQENWDWIKQKVKAFIKSFQLEIINWRKKQLTRLQSKRNMMLRKQKHFQVQAWRLPVTEQRISSLQEQADLAMLRAGKTWREKDEESPGYLKALVKQQEQQKSIGDLTDPVTAEIYSDQESSVCEAK